MLKHRDILSMHAWDNMWQCWNCRCRRDSARVWWSTGQVCMNKLLVYMYKLLIKFCSCKLVQYSTTHCNWSWWNFNDWYNWDNLSIYDYLKFVLSNCEQRKWMHLVLSVCSYTLTYLRVHTVNNQVSKLNSFITVACYLC